VVYQNGNGDWVEIVKQILDTYYRLDLHPAINNETDYVGWANAINQVSYH
jgi:hypothetical protein